VSGVVQSRVSHVYAKPGIYHITLNVTHNNTVSNYTSLARIFGTHALEMGNQRSLVGLTQPRETDCTGNATSEIVVQGNRTKDSLVTVWACIPERTNPNYTITYRCDTSLSFSLMQCALHALELTSASPLRAHSWDFGDKSVDVPQLRRNQVLQHVFNATGSFNITVSVDLDGDIGTVEKSYTTIIKISSGAHISRLLFSLLLSLRARNTESDLVATGTLCDVHVRVR
jgi:PKD repeat protein